MLRTYFNFMGEDFIAQIEYRVSYFGCRGRISGPPERCFPDEPAEFEIDNIELWPDLGVKPQTPGFLATGALFDSLCEFFFDRVETHIFDNGPDTDWID
jgi:hypothetical protein